MADRFTATLKVRRADYEADPKLKELLDLEEEDADDEGVFKIIDFQAPYGEFSEIESYCINNAIAFDRWSESYCEYRSEMRMFRPGDEPIDQIVFLASDDDGPFVECECIKAIFGDLSLSEKEKLQQIYEQVLKKDYPCKQIEEYRSSREANAA